MANKKMTPEEAKESLLEALKEDGTGGEQPTLNPELSKFIRDL